MKSKPSRRDLFSAASAMLAGSVAAQNGEAATTVRFGVRGPLPKTGLRERAMLVKEAGFDGIELGPEWLDRPVESIQKDLEGTGAAVSAIVGSIGLLDTDPAKRAQAVE